MSQTQIEWSQAVQDQKESEAEKIRFEAEMEENRKLARAELWERMGEPGFRFSEAEDIVLGYGLDLDELETLLM